MSMPSESPRISTRNGLAAVGFVMLGAVVGGVVPPPAVLVADGRRARLPAASWAAQP